MAAVESHPPSTLSGVNSIGYFASFVCAGAVIIACLGPWALTISPLGPIALSGTTTPDGKIAIVAGGIAVAVLLLRSTVASNFILAIGALAGIVTTVAGFTGLRHIPTAFGDNSTTSGSTETVIVAGWGLWLLCVSSLLLLTSLMVALTPAFHVSTRPAAQPRTPTSTPAPKDSDHTFEVESSTFTPRRVSGKQEAPSGEQKNLSPTEWGAIAATAFFCIAAIAMVIWAFSI
ncbi:hypothetical protein EV641_10823 [Rhodococcus sp. SMB37]|uniref:hypothetical protein n=1 Tax=Rhodococcus sp. SMB37 TaxID=2512213 RepID=UPI0010441DAD|nr:hypothetical protein [Rhodococcus sp. SMB37]TCN52148.1 hypothetical protein EV641_10823 [Rhodococcus sp. SMB37]